MLYPHLLEFAGSEADWIRRTGVLIAVIGTAVAAPGGTAFLWRMIKASPQQAWRLARALLRRLFPGRYKAVTGSVNFKAGGAANRASGSATATVGWSDATPLEQRIEILRENLSRAQEEIRNVRQEARREVAELRAALEQRLQAIEAGHQAHQAAHVAAEREGSKVDARGVFLLGMGAVMAGVPDGLARFGWFGWFLAAAAFTGASIVAGWAASE